VPGTGVKGSATVALCVIFSKGVGLNARAEWLPEEVLECAGGVGGKSGPRTQASDESRLVFDGAAGSVLGVILSRGRFERFWVAGGLPPAESG
jgi:hypothetical protein